MLREWPGGRMVRPHRRTVILGHKAIEIRFSGMEVELEGFVGWCQERARAHRGHCISHVGHLCRGTSRAVRKEE